MEQNEQITLIVRILRPLLSDAILPCYAYGANVGQCRYCGAVGSVKYPNIVYSHQEACPFTLLERLEEKQTNA